MTGGWITQADRSRWQQRAAAELAAILAAHPDIPVLAWTVTASGGALSGQVLGASMTASDPSCRSQGARRSSRPHYAGLPGTSTGQRPVGNDSPVLPACRQTQFVTMTLWVDAWQVQCCGEPFRLGSKAAWTVREADPDWLEAVLGAEAAPGVDGAEEHHGGIPQDAEPTRGAVTRIWAVHCRYAPRPGDPRALYPVPGSGVLTDVESADGWIADRGEERFVGYVVRLDQVNCGTFDQVNCDANDDLVAYRDAELALLAARFSLPGPCLPDVDRAIDLACRLLAGNQETPATTEVACLSYGTPLRDAEPVLRQMLTEHGIAVASPGAGGADQFRAALRAFGSRAIGIGEFSAIFYRLLPAWNEQDAAQHTLVLLLSELNQATTREDQDEIIQRLRDTALAASQET